MVRYVSDAGDALGSVPGGTTLTFHIHSTCFSRVSVSRRITSLNSNHGAHAFYFVISADETECPGANEISPECNECRTEIPKEMQCSEVVEHAQTMSNNNGQGRGPRGPRGEGPAGGRRPKPEMVACTTQCRCMRGYARDAEGNCVELDECFPEGMFIEIIA